MTSLLTIAVAALSLCAAYLHRRRSKGVAWAVTGCAAALVIGLSVAFDVVVTKAGAAFFVVVMIGTGLLEDRLWPKRKEDPGW